MITRIFAGVAPLAALLLACTATVADPTMPPKAPAIGAQDFVFLAEARPVLVRLHVRSDGKPLQAAYDDLMKYLFDYLDINHDGVLTKDEVERAPTVEQIGGSIAVRFGGGGRGGRGGAPGGPSMKDFDADGDGKVTLAEMSDYYRKKGLVPFRFQLDPPAANPLGAAAVFLGGPRPEPSVDAVSAAIFKLLDTDKDGKLTRQKLVAAPALLLRLDEDEDEIVTTQELVTDSSPNLGQLAGMFAMGRPGKAEEKHSSPTLVPVLTPGEVPADLVKRMRERYGKGEKLTQKDVRLDDATFRRLDTNGDGTLDDAELAGFVKGPPDLEFVVWLGGQEKAGPRLEIVRGEGKSSLAAKLRTEDDQTLLDLGRTWVDFRANSEDPSDRLGGIIRDQFVAQFRAADTNGDGFVDAEEAAKSRQLKTLFKALDRNGAGKVTEKDLLAYLDHLQELQKRAQAGCVTLELTDQSRGLFDALDTDRDGRLSVREMRQAPKLLERLDRDGKGFITREDLPRSYRLELHRGPSGGAGNDPAALFVRYLAPTAKTETERVGRGPLWFRKMDCNRDGDVSRKEFLFGEELFRKIDTDGDGLISVEEAERYDALHRKGK